MILGRQGFPERDICVDVGVTDIRVEQACRFLNVPHRMEILVRGSLSWPAVAGAAGITSATTEAITNRYPSRLICAPFDVVSDNAPPRVLMM